MNGLELNDKLNDLTDRFVKWYNESLFEIRLETIEEWEAKSGNKTFISKLKADKDAIKKSAMSKGEDTDLDSIDMYRLLEMCIRDSFMTYGLSIILPGFIKSRRNLRIMKGESILRIVLMCLSKTQTNGIMLRDGLIQKRHLIKVSMNHPQTCGQIMVKRQSMTPVPRDIR